MMHLGAILMSLLFQEDTAEQVFGKIEAAILSAKVLSVSYTCDVKGPPKSATAISGNYQTKHSNKMMLIVKWADGDMRLISDGKKIVGTGSGKEPPPAEDVKPGYTQHITKSLVRCGFGASDSFGFLFPLGEDDFFKTGLTLSDFKFGEESKGERSLSYVVRLHQTSIRMKCTLWFEPKTLVLKKRVLTHGADVEEVTFTELYSEFNIEKDIPDSVFTLPSK